MHLGSVNAASEAESSEEAGEHLKDDRPEILKQCLQGFEEVWKAEIHHRYSIEPETL